MTSPDLVVIVDRKRGEGVTNTLLDADEEVAVIGIKGRESFRSERGLGGAGPRFSLHIDLYFPLLSAWTQRFP